MIRTSFLPSDDSPRLPYFVPANAFACTELRGVAALLRNLSTSSPSSAATAAGPAAAAAAAVAEAKAEADSLAVRAEALAAEVAAGIAEWGVVTHSSGKKIYAMEVSCQVSALVHPSASASPLGLASLQRALVGGSWFSRAETLAARLKLKSRSPSRTTHLQVDGYGNYFFGDDANVPSLLALPFYGFVDPEDETYQVRARVCGCGCWRGRRLWAGVRVRMRARVSALPLTNQRQATRALLLRMGL
jgi:meiotically up-regulated gene 157 (Mug157) protein